MSRRLLAAILVCLVLIVTGCGGGARYELPPVGSQDDAQGSEPSAGTSSAPGGGSTSEAGGTQVAAGSGAAGTAAAAGSGGSSAGPRTDGCAEDAPLALDRVLIRPAPEQGSRIVGARIQGSNSGPTTDFVDLATISRPFPDGVSSSLSFPNMAAYRYLRFYAPPDSTGGVAEIEFYHGMTRLRGMAFGTAIGDSQHPFAHALDENNETYFAAAAGGGGAYVGIDIARGHVTEPVKFSPEGRSSMEPIRVTLTTATKGATVRYTTDGSNPTAKTGEMYTEPFEVKNGRTNVRALASSNCNFDSAVAQATYTVGASSTPVTGGLKTYHIGNSLTDTINPWLEPIADSTGVDHVYARWTIPGAPIKWLAEHQGEGFQDPEGANRFDTFVKSFAPIDHLSLQPYSDPDWISQGAAAVKLMTTALQYSPDIQFWMYAQWPGKTEWATDAISNGGGNVFPDWQVMKKASNWDEGVQNAALYYEAFRDYVDQMVGGKPILIVPGGLALLELKRQMEAGMVPGYSDFFTSMFEDEVHVNVPAQYLVALVFYSCLYRQSPEGKVTFAGTGLTEEQAKVLQRIAWKVASGYPGSGI